MMARVRGLVASSFALTLGTLLGPTALGDPIGYETSGLVDNQSLLRSPLDDLQDPFPIANRKAVGPEVVTFQGIGSGSFDPSSPVPLGEFVLAPVAGSGSTYNHVPFSIEVHVPSLGHYDGSFHVGSLLIGGHLDGTVEGTGRSDLKASFDSTRLESNNPFRYAVNYVFEFPVPLPAVKLPGTVALASESGGGRFAVALEVNAVPEPTSAAVFLAALAVIIRRRSGTTSTARRLRS